MTPLLCALNKIEMVREETKGRSCKSEVSRAPFVALILHVFCPVRNPAELDSVTLVSQCSATVRHCSCYTRCSATPFYDIDMANLRCYNPPPQRTEAAATVDPLRGVARQ